MLLVLSHELIMAAAWCPQEPAGCFDPLPLATLRLRIESYLEAIDPENRYLMLEKGYDQGLCTGIQHASLGPVTALFGTLIHDISVADYHEALRTLHDRLMQAIERGYDPDLASFLLKVHEGIMTHARYQDDRRRFAA